MYTRSPHYLYKRNGIYYFTRQVPSDLKTKFNKNRVVISLRTSSKQKAIESANKLTDRLETYWNTLRLELFHTKELKLSFLDNQKSKTETVNVYGHWTKGVRSGGYNFRNGNQLIPPGPTDEEIVDPFEL